MLGAPAYLDVLRKLRLPYLLNHFSLACADVLLSDPEMTAHLEKIKTNAIAGRTGVERELSRIADAHGYKVKRSEANFLLIRWPTQEGCQRAYQRLIEQGVLVRNVSGGQGLTGCLRATLGNDAENQALIRAFQGI